MTIGAMIEAPRFRSYRRRARLTWRRTSLVCSSLVILLSVVNLLGWALDSRELISWIVGITPMKITGSLALITIAVPIFRISRYRRIQRFDRVLLGVGAVVSCITGIYAVGISVVARVQTGALVLPPETLVAIAESPYIVPLSSGVSFLLLGASLTLLPRDWVRKTQWSNGLALAAGANAMLTLFGYAYGVPSFFDEHLYIPMPLAVAVSFLLVSIAINTSHPRFHLLGILFTEGPGGKTSRRLLPAALLVPFLFGVFHLIMESTDLMGPELASAAETTLITSLLVGLILSHALGMERESARVERIQHERDEEVQSRLLLWEISDDLLCMLGYDGYVKRLNPAWERTLGWPIQDLLLRPFIELVHPEDREKTLAEIENLACGNRSIGFTNRYRQIDGSYRTLQWSAAPCGDQGQIIGIARDVTDMVEARQRILNINRELETRVRARTRELEATNKELESFSYAVSHDLRAPLRAIEGFSKLVIDRYATDIPPQGHHYLQRVRAGATKMAELIDGIHALSRLNRGTLKIENIDLSEIATDIISDLRATDPERNVEVVIEPGLAAEGDRGLLRSLLLNLIGNAWKFTSRTEKARIEVGSSPGEDREFFVQDNGAGFDPRHVGKLFSPFQRLHTNDEFEGSGLGLATVQRIVNRHGGVVRAEGSPENGAKFSFSLPSLEEQGSRDHLGVTHPTDKQKLKEVI